MSGFQLCECLCVCGWVVLRFMGTFLTCHRPHQASGEIQGLSPNSLFFFVCPRSPLTNPSLPQSSDTRQFCSAFSLPPRTASLSLFSCYLHPSCFLLAALSPSTTPLFHLMVAALTIFFSLLFHNHSPFSKTASPPSLCPLLPTAAPDAASLLLLSLSWP